MDERRLQRLDRLADTLDSRYRIPGTGIRFGLDSILGLIPGVGDLVALGPSAYVITEGYRMGASKGVLARMMANAGFDFALGAIPLVGDVFDLFFKDNRRNVRLLRSHLERKAARQPA